MWQAGVAMRTYMDNPLSSERAPQFKDARQVGSVGQRLSPEQREQLERRFLQNRYIGTEERDKLAEALGLTSEFVRLWFQRMRVKTGTTQPRQPAVKSVKPPQSSVSFYVRQVFMLGGAAMAGWLAGQELVQKRGKSPQELH